MIAFRKGFLLVVSPLATALSMAFDADPDLDIPANSPAMEAIRRIQARSTTLLPNQAFPQRSGEASDYLGKNERLPSDEATFLYHYPGARKELVRWSDTARQNALYLSPALESGYFHGRIGDEPDIRGLGGLGFQAYGRLKSSLVFYSRGMAYTEKTNRAQFGHMFTPDKGEFYSVEKGPDDSLLSDRTFARFEYYVLLDLPWLTIKAGRDRVHLGPGYFSSLTASRDTPPYYLVEGRIDFAPWLKLNSYLLKMTDTEFSVRKYANLHRFELKPHPSLSLGLLNSVIYQDRDPDPAYLLPLMPLTVSEQSNGGRDNAGISLDFTYTGIRNVSMWGEVFVDDLLGPGTFFDDFWENRWAALAGFQAVSPWKRLDADVVVEYSRVEPWTYNGRQPYTSYKHFDAASASKLGPDSRSWDVQVSYRPLPWLQLRSRGEWNEKGTGRGATLGVIHDDAIDGKRKTFLAKPTVFESLYTQEVSALWSQFVSGRAFWSRDAETGEDWLGADVRAGW